MPDRRDISTREAAETRRAHYRALSDRPRQRSSSPDAVANHVRAATRIQYRAAQGDAGPGFTGYASVTEQGYEMWDFFGPYMEIVSAGGFGKTLASHPEVPLVLQHYPQLRLAATWNETLALAEDDEGLRVDAENLDMRVSYVADTVYNLERDLYREMSFMFWVTAGQWSPDYTEYRINEVDLNRGDVSIVGFGANPLTSAELRSGQLSELIRDADLEQLRIIAAKANMRIRDLTGAAPMTSEELRAIRF